MRTCDEACDHLFEAATLSAQLVTAETERDAALAALKVAREALEEIRRDHSRDRAGYRMLALRALTRISELVPRDPR